MALDQKQFTLFVVPPNVTGNLHLGHAMMISVQDTVVRWKRLQGMDVTFLFGTDHAGISTQYVVEQKCRENGLDRLQMGREQFLKHTWKWVKEYDNRITRQVRSMAASCDWSRHKMTLDSDYYRAVQTSFVRLYEDGLIYYGDYMTNWCPCCQTSLSDLEVEWSSEMQEIREVDWQLEEGQVPVLFANQDLMFGATALLVDPDHPAAGKRAMNPVNEEWVPVLADRNLRNLGLLPTRGDAAILCVPGHQGDHFRLARKLELEVRAVYGKSGRRITEKTALENEVAKRSSLVTQQEQKIPTCSRCGERIIQLISKQWFVKMKPLADRLLPYIETKKIVFHPASTREVTLHWLNKIEDWCISRQIWWGHQIPCWTCTDCQQMVVQVDEPEMCAHCSGEHFNQSEEVLDTWFSSAHWNFAYLGWPQKTPELMQKYPADLIETGRDILFFWVIRMMLMGLYHLEELPAYEIYLHGLVLDGNGQKMSKSRGNVIDVEEKLAQYGADVVRYALLLNCEAGRDINIFEQYFLQGRQLITNLKALVQAYLENRDRFSRDRWLQHGLEQWVQQSVMQLQVKMGLDLEQLSFSSYVSEAEKTIRSLHDLYMPWLYSEEAQGDVEVVLEQLLIALHPLFPETTTMLWSKWKGEQESMTYRLLPPVDDVANVTSLFDLLQLMRQLQGILGDQHFALIQVGLEKEGELIPYHSYIQQVTKVHSIHVVEHLQGIVLPINDRQAIQLLNHDELEMTRLSSFAQHLLKEYSRKLKSVSKRLQNKKYVESVTKLRYQQEDTLYRDLEFTCSQLKDTIKNMVNH